MARYVSTTTASISSSRENASKTAGRGVASGGCRHSLRLWAPITPLPALSRTCDSSHRSLLVGGAASDPGFGIWTVLRKRQPRKTEAWRQAQIAAVGLQPVGRSATGREQPQGLQFSLPTRPAVVEPEPVEVDVEEVGRTAGGQRKHVWILAPSRPCAQQLKTGECLACKRGLPVRIAVIPRAGLPLRTGGRSARQPQPRSRPSESGRPDRAARPLSTPQAARRGGHSSAEPRGERALWSPPAESGSALGCVLSERL